MEVTSSKDPTQKSTLVLPSDVSADFAITSEEGDPQDAAAADEVLKDSSRVEQLYLEAVRVSEKGDERETLTHFLLAAKHAEKASEWHLAAIALHAAGDIFRKSGPEHSLERASRMYRRAIAAYGECGNFAQARNLDYQVSSNRLWHSGELKLPMQERVELFLFWLTAGFGMRPLRVLGSGIVMILVFATIYWATGGITTSDGDSVTDFGSAAYFSGSTFLTINYGDLLPATHMRWVTVLEGLAGLTMSGFFVVVMANRLRC